MGTTNVVIVVAILALVVSIGIGLYYYRKRNLEQFFNQVYEEIKHVPKQKKNSFLLLMFKESLSSSMNKSNKNTFATKMQNRKYLDIQLVRMSNILKDTSKVQDKLTKRSLTMLSDYQAWEKAKLANDNKSVQDKAS